MSKIYNEQEERGNSKLIDKSLIQLHKKQSVINQKELSDHYTTIKLLVVFELQKIGYKKHQFEEYLNSTILKNDVIPSTNDKNHAMLIVKIIVDKIQSFHNTIKQSPSKNSIIKKQSQSIRSEQNQNYSSSSDKLFVLKQQSKNLIVQTLQCPICYGMNAEKNINCEHNFCLECIRGHLRQKIYQGIYDVKCPEQNCQYIISNQKINQLLTQQQFTRFERLKIKNVEENDQNNQFCRRPDCGTILKRDFKASKLICLKCKAQFCSNCMQQWHQERTCDTFIQQSLEQTFNVFMIKKCPHCSAPIQKISGCNHMKCTKCKFQFCWICLKKSTKHHYRIYNCFGCPGMQFEQNSDINTGLLVFMFYLLIPLILILALIILCIALPLYILMYLVLKPFSWIKKPTNKCEYKLLYNCIDPLHGWNSVILFIMFIPRAIIMAIFYAPFKCLFIIIHEIWDLVDQ